ncbi:MAG: efflux RND transporter permease subunit [Bacteroidales bacterium]|nr:efflux RND transporter permease subunit [Bacteroidales bacterium]
MIKLTRFSVKYPVTITMLVFAVLLLGYISFNRLGTDLFPDLRNPRLFVELHSGEKPPSEIESRFAENIESLGIRQNGVTDVSTEIGTGRMLTTIHYEWGQDMNAAFLDLQKALSSVATNQEVDELNIYQNDPNAAPIMRVIVSNADINDMNLLRQTAENYIYNQLVRLNGVADVELSGEEEAQLLIQTESYLMDAHGLSMDEISSRIQAFNRDISGGTLEEKGTEYLITGESLLGKVEDFRNLIVGYQQKTSRNNERTQIPVTLEQVADVQMKNKDPDNMVYFNGERCIGLAIYKEQGKNTVDIVKLVDQALTDLNKALPGYRFTVVENQGEYIDQAIGEVENTALIGILLAVFVLFLFLRRLRVTLIVSVAIPISIIATFNLMYFNGLSLNVMTLGGLALGAGMLVDNAIVVIENIFRHIEEGSSVKDAAIQGTAEMGGAITASTLTTIVVFLPIVYLHGESGELFKEEAWTVAFSLLSSLFVALLVIPVMTDKWIKAERKKTLKSVNIGWYGRWLSGILNKRWLVIGLSAGLIGFAALLLPRVGSEFMPKSQGGAFAVSIELPGGTRLEKTARVGRQVQAMMDDAFGDKVSYYYLHVGPGTEEDAATTELMQGSNFASIQVQPKEGAVIRPEEVIALTNSSLGDVSGLKIEYKQKQTSLDEILGTDASPLVVQTSGEELEQIESITENIRKELTGIEGLYDVKTNFDKGAPEIEVRVDRYQAGMYNISLDQIVNQIERQLTGMEIGEFDREGEMTDITLKLPDLSRKDLEELELRSGNQVIRLDQIATFHTGQSPGKIYRENQKRVGKVMARIEEDITLDRVVKKVNAKLAGIEFPARYQTEITGEEQKRAESFASLKFALILSIILVYMVMASQFESLLHPMTILLSLPLAFTGPVFLFLGIGESFNIIAYIGIIMLAGIAVNNSIILVDAIRRYQRQGMVKRDAILQAGQNRIRPIVMTSITTILALLPLTIDFGQSAELRSPMAWAVIGGLITSTILTLVTIPCVYYIFQRKEVLSNPEDQE